MNLLITVCCTFSSQFLSGVKCRPTFWWLLPGLLQRKHSKTTKLYHSEILHLATFQIYKDIRNIKGASGQAEPGQFQSPRGIPPRQPAPGVANYPPALVDPTQDPRGGGDSWSSSRCWALHFASGRRARREWPQRKGAIHQFALDEWSAAEMN